MNSEQAQPSLEEFAAWRIRQMNESSIVTDEAISIRTAVEMRRDTVEQQIQINEGAN